MLLAYFDDSGEAGTFLLSCVVVQEDHWLQMLDAWNDYRRWLRRDFKLRMSRGSGRRVAVPVHATDMITGSKDWRNLPVGREGRVRALRAGLRLIGRHATVFSIAWLPSRPIRDSYAPFHESPAIDCWRVGLERLASHSLYDHGGGKVVTFTDQGYETQMTRVLRKMRRYHQVGSLYGGTLNATAPMLLDDPIPRVSRMSAFIQMADLCAYAALRELHPRPGLHGLWTELSNGINRSVNKYTRGQPPGIKLLPPD